MARTGNLSASAVARSELALGKSPAGAVEVTLAKTGNLSPVGVRQAIISGSTMANFSTQGVSCDRLRGLPRWEVIAARYHHFLEFSRF